MIPIIQTGIEISVSDNPPHIQAPLRTKRVGYAQRLVPPFSERVKVGERSIAQIDVAQIGDNLREIFYRLDYRERGAKQIKAWMMVDYSRQVKLLCGGKWETIDVERHMGREFEDITSGIHWVRVDGWVKQIHIIQFNHHRIEVMNPEDVDRFIVYRRRDRSRLEFAWVWKRGNIPHTTYELRIRIGNQNT